MSQQQPAVVAGRRARDDGREAQDRFAVLSDETPVGALHERLQRSVQQRLAEL